MADSLSNDEIFQAELRDFYTRNAGNSRENPNSNTSGDDDDGLAPPPAYASRRVVLKSPPVFVPFKGHLRFHRRMKSQTSILAVVLIAIIGHRILVANLRHDTSISQFVLAPIVITTVMAMATMWLHFYQLNNAYKQPNLDLKFYLIWNTWAPLVAVCLIAPLLALPIFASTLVVSDEVLIGNTTYATMLSWSQTITRLKMSFPSVMEAGEKATSPLNPWVAITQTGIRFPDTMTFPLKDNILSSRDHNYDYNPEDAYGVYMPILAWGEVNPSLDNVLERDLNATTQVLAVKLNCQFANISNLSLQNTSKGEAVLSVHLQDKDSCATQIGLRGLRLETTDQHTFFKKLGGFDDESIVDFVDLLKFYSDIGNSSSPITAYTPGWSRLSSNDKYVNERLCPARLGLVGLSRPLHPEGIIPSISTFEAAICEPDFMIADLNVTFRKGRTVQFHGPASMASQGAYLGRMTPKYTENFLSNFTTLETSQNARLREALISDAIEFSVFGNRWAWSVIKAGLENFRLFPQQRIGSLLLAGSLIRRSFLSKLATIAELTLREQMTDAGPDVQLRVAKEYATARAVRQVFQDGIFFQASTWQFFIFLCMAIVFHSVDDESNISVHGRFLWPISSPLARAMLLRYSSVLPWLHELKTGHHWLNDLPTMRIGDWSVHEEVGESGWRLDSIKLPVRIPKSGKPGKLDPQLRHDFIAKKTLVQLSIIASVSIVGCLILQGLAVNRGRGHDKLSDMAELWRILGYADFEVEVSLMEIIFWHLIPRSLVFYCVFFWLPSVYRFLCGRQAWSSMIRKMQPSHKSITLDYTIRRFNFVYAIKNKHWFIAVLSVSNLIIFLVPALQSRMLGISQVREWLSDAHSITDRHFEWAVNLASTPETGPFDKALGDLARSSLFSHDVSHWSASEASILPLELKSWQLSGARYGFVDTTALFANLECEEATIASILEHGYNQSMEVLVHLDESPSSRVRIPLPCSMLPKDMESSQSASTQQALCMRWWLHSSSHAPSQPYWILLMANASGTWSAPHHVLQFSESPSVISVTCRSTLRRKQAQVLIPTNISTKNSTRVTTSPILYKLRGDWLAVNESIVAALNNGLDRSNMALDGFDGGVIASDPLLHTDRFAGDFLSWTLYQQVFAACSACRNANVLRHSASRLYSAYVAALVDQRSSSSVLTKLSTNATHIDIQALNVQIENNIDWSAVGLQFTFILFCVGVLCVIFRTRRQYIMPLSPEPLLNSLILLCESNIIPRLENEVPYPEMLRLEDVYNRVDGWGLQCTLDSCDNNELITLATKSAGLFGGLEIQEPHHDDIPI